MTADLDSESRVAPGRWMAGRARNLAHRSGVLLVTGGTTFAIVFGLLLWFTRSEREALQLVPVRADTVDLARRAASMRRLQLRADSALAEVPVPRRMMARAAAVMSSVPADSALPDSAADAPVAVAVASDSVVQLAPQVPDSLRLAAAALSARLQRAQNAPLAASWRALAADPMLQQEPRIRALTDSLVEAERERNEYDAVGGVDPIYLELSSRVTAIGRAIERIAAQRIAVMLRPVGGGSVVVQRAGPSADELGRRYAADSIRYAIARAKRDAAARVADSVAMLLDAQRRAAIDRDGARVRAQRRVDALAPPAAMLSASIAAALGVALFITLGFELRSPRIADEREVVALARVPVLLNIRAIDATSPESLTSAFSQLVFALDDALQRAHSVFVIGEDEGLATRTAARIAERLGSDGRRVRVVSPRQGAVRPALPRPGRKTPGWSQSVLVQPERTQGLSWTGEYPGDALTEDTITVRSGTMSDVRGALADRSEAASVLLVTRIGATRALWVTTVSADLQKLRGESAHGVVVWAPGVDDADPVAYALDSAARRPAGSTYAEAR